MVKYSYTWTSCNNCFFMYGGINMYLKTNLKDKGLLSLDNPNSDILNDSTEDLYLNVLFNIGALDNFIDERIEEISRVSRQNKSLNNTSEFLNNWKDNRKSELFTEIQQIINLGNLINEKLVKLNKRIDRYFKYFDLIDKEKNINDKYEEMFNTLVQIPSEIYNFIEEGKSNQNGKFIEYDYNYQNNKPSSVLIEDGYFYKFL